VEKNRKLHDANQQNALIEKLWLHYYNQTLYDKSIISDSDYTRMKAKINSRRNTV
jgi:hypothetical protein